MKRPAWFQRKEEKKREIGGEGKQKKKKARQWEQARGTGKEEKASKEGREER